MNQNLKRHQIFEAVVHVVQLAFKDNPNTLIHRNYKVPVRTGRKREIDVLIESSINGVSICIAIECKDLKRKVSVKEIEAFKTKCERIPSINKMIMVSRSGYQADAMDAAEEFGIERHQLEELTIERVQGWFRSNLIQPGMVETTLKECQVEFVGKAPNLNLSPNDILYPCGSLTGIEIVDYIKLGSRQLLMEARPIPLKETETSEIISIVADCPNSTLMVEGNPYAIAKIHAKIIRTYRIKQSSISLAAYKSSNEDHGSVQTATIITNDEPAITLVRGASDSEMDLYLSSKSDSIHYANIKIERKGAEGKLNE